MAPHPGQILGHTQALTAVDWSADGTRILTAGLDGRAYLWRADEFDRPPVTVFTGARPVARARLAPDGRRVAALVEGEVQVWDDKAGTALPALDRWGDVETLAWSPDGAHLAVLDRFDRVAVWTSPPDGPVEVVGRAQAVAWSGPSRLVGLAADAALTWDGLRNWTVDDQATIPEMPVDVAWSGDGQWVAVATSDGLLAGPNLLELRSVAVPPRGSYRRSLRLAAPTRGPRFLMWDPTPTVIDLETGTVLVQLTEHGYRDAAFSPDGQRLVTCAARVRPQPPTRSQSPVRAAEVRRTADLVVEDVIDGRWSMRGERLGTLVVPTEIVGDGLRGRPTVRLPIEVRDASLHSVGVSAYGLGDNGFDLIPGLYQVRTLGRDGEFRSEVHRVVAGQSNLRDDSRTSGRRRVLINVHGDIVGRDQLVRAASPFVMIETLGADALTDDSPWILEAARSSAEMPTALFRHPGGLHRCSLPIEQGSPSAATRCLVVSTTGPDGGDRLVVTAGTGRELVGLVENMIRAGTVLEAPRILDQALHLLEQKQADPPGAALGALCLHRIGQLTMQPSWVENLARWYPWLADGQVLLAALLAEGVRAERDRGLDLLLAAARKRLLLTDGLALLISLLRRWPDDFRNRARGRALRDLAPLLAGVDWEAIYLTNREGG